MATSPLFWQQVHAPNFSPVLDAYRVSGALMQDALKGLGGAFDSFNNANREAADKAVLANIMTRGNSGDLQNILRDGSFLGGANIQDVSADTLRAIGSRQKDLMDQDYTRQRMDVLGEEASRARDAHAASPAVQALMQAAYAGDERAIASLSAENQALLNGLGAAGIQNLYTGVQGMKDSRLNNENTRSIINTRGADLSMRQSEHRQNLAQRAATANAASQSAQANAIVGALLQSSGGDPTVIQQGLDTLSQSMTPTLYKEVLENLNKFNGGTKGTGSTTVSNTSGGSIDTDNGLSNPRQDLVNAAQDALNLSGQVFKAGAFNPTLVREAAAKNSTPAAVVTELLDGPMKGISEAQITSALDDIMTELKIGPDLAGLLVQSGQTDGLISGRNISDRAVRNIIDRYKGGDALYNMRGAERLGRISSNISTQNQKVIDLESRIRDLDARSDNNPNLAKAADSLRKQLTKENDKLGNMLSEARQYSNPGTVENIDPVRQIEPTGPVNFRNMNSSDLELLKRYLR